MSSTRKRDNFAWGLVLVILGLIFLLHNIDIKLWGSVARLWPLILIIWGAWKLYYGLQERKEQKDSLTENNSEEQ
ncbi:MAG: LiaF transmembrane domain-containing protein [Acidobacteriota bacterium]